MFNSNDKLVSSLLEDLYVGIKVLIPFLVQIFKKIFYKIDQKKLLNNYP